MNEDGTALLSIGQLARRTGLTVKTIRYWSDIGVVPPADRTPAGSRRYDAQAVERLELVRTLRELGVGIEEIRGIVERQRSVAEVAEVVAVHVTALDARIRLLRLQRAVLRSVAARGSTTEEITLMNKLARLSAEERTPPVLSRARSVGRAGAGSGESGRTPGGAAGPRGSAAAGPRSVVALVEPVSLERPAAQGRLVGFPGDPLQVPVIGGVTGDLPQVPPQGGRELTRCHSQVTSVSFPRRAGAG
jgi:DNA-binding transcriptional MerR regulator